MALSIFGNYGTFKNSPIRREPAKLDVWKDLIILFGRSGCQSMDVFGAKTFNQPSFAGPGKAKIIFKAPSLHITNFNNSKTLMKRLLTR